MEIEITFRDVLRATRVRLGKAAWYIAFMWCVGVVHAVRGPQVVLGLFLTAMVPLTLGAMYRSYAKLDDVHRRVETRVDSDGVHHRTGGSSSVIAFADIARVRWTKHVVLLFLATGAVATVLTRGVDEESLRTLRQATETRTESSGSILKVLVAIAALAVVFAWLWTVVARGR